MVEVDPRVGEVEVEVDHRVGEVGHGVHELRGCRR